MGIAAVSGPSLPGQSPAETEKAIGEKSSVRKALSGVGALRTYDGKTARDVAFPLGGIGTGTVSLGARGELRDWEIFNRPAKGRTLPFSFVALWL